MKQLFQLFANFDVTQVYQIAIPFGTPAPSAFVMGISLHKYMVAALGGDYEWAAWIISVIGVLGMEGVGGMSSIMVSRAYTLRRWDIMIMAIIAVFGYAGFVGVGIYTGQDSMSILSTVALTLLGYFVLAIYDSIKSVQSQNTLDLAKTQTDIEKMDAERKLLNSKARLAASTGQVDSVHLSNGQNGQAGRAKFDAAKLEWMREYHERNPTATLRNIIEENTCPFSSPETARKYLAEVTK